MSNDDLVWKVWVWGFLVALPLSGPRATTTAKSAKMKSGIWWCRAIIIIHTMHGPIATLTLRDKKLSVWSNMTF